MENKELGRLILKQEEAEPWSFRMSHWATRSDCGTTACIAGHAMLMSGYSLRVCEIGSTRIVAFIRPDGSEVFDHTSEGMKLLGFSRSCMSVLRCDGSCGGYHDPETGHGLFTEFDDQRALDRLRELCEDDQ
jgi:hypothetical protein